MEVTQALLAFTGKLSCNLYALTLSNLDVKIGLTQPPNKFPLSLSAMIGCFNPVLHLTTDFWFLFQNKSVKVKKNKI